jgi:hypothetical protein
MTVLSNIAASWEAFELAGMLHEATWTPQGGTGTDALVMFDAPGASVIEGVYSADYSVVYRVSDWPNVREGDAITVGAAYKVREVLALTDGLLSRAFVSKR